MKKLMSFLVATLFAATLSPLFAAHTVKKSTTTAHAVVASTATKKAVNPLIPTEKVVVLTMEYDVMENPFTGEMFKPSSLCTGSFIGTKGQILTAAHCVDSDKILNVEVKTSDGKKYKAQVLHVSDKSDLALLKITTSTVYAPFEVATSMAQGDTIYTLGHPLRKEYTLTKGIVASMEEPEQHKTLVDMTVLPGNSGGPVYDSHGKLVGVVSAGYIVYMGTTGLNLVVSLKQVTEFLDLFRGL